MKLLTTTLIAVVALSAPAVAKTINVTIENNSDPNGVYFTPFLNVLHDGTYTPFVQGQAASAGLEELAELGGTSAAASEAVDGADPERQIETLVEATGVGDPAVGGPPVFDPGNSATISFTLDTTNRFLTLLSMVIPSNDTFISATFDLFDTNGILNEGTFNLGFTNLFDAGTEVNQPLGQAFNTADGNGPGLLGDDENGVVHQSSNTELATLFGQPLPPFAGGGLTNENSVSFLSLATVRIEDVTVPAPVPLPAAGWALLAALGGLGAMARRRNKAA